jgi:hypothetical protein
MYPLTNRLYSAPDKKQAEKTELNSPRLPLGSP